MCETQFYYNMQLTLFGDYWFWRFFCNYNSHNGLKKKKHYHDGKVKKSIQKYMINCDFLSKFIRLNLIFFLFIRPIIYVTKYTKYKRTFFLRWYCEWNYENKTVLQHLTRLDWHPEFWLHFHSIFDDDLSWNNHEMSFLNCLTFQNCCSDFVLQMCFSDAWHLSRQRAAGTEILTMPFLSRRMSSANQMTTTGTCFRILKKKKRKLR